MHLLNTKYMLYMQWCDSLMIVSYTRLASLDDRNIHVSPSLSLPSSFTTRSIARPTSPLPPVTNTRIGPTDPFIWQTERERWGLMNTSGVNIHVKTRTIVNNQVFICLWWFFLIVMVSMHQISLKSSTAVFLKDFVYVISEPATRTSSYFSSSLYSSQWTTYKWNW